MVKISEYSSKGTETEFNKPVAMIEKNHEDFNNSTECWICKKCRRRR